MVKHRGREQAPGSPEQHPPAVQTTFCATRGKPLEKHPCPMQNSSAHAASCLSTDRTEVATAQRSPCKHMPRLRAGPSLGLRSFKLCPKVRFLGTWDGKASPEAQPHGRAVANPAGQSWRCRGTQHAWGRSAMGRSGGETQRSMQLARALVHRAGDTLSFHLRPTRRVGQRRARWHHPAAPGIRAGSGDETWPLLFLVPDKKIICHRGAGWVSGLGVGGWVFIGESVSLSTRPGEQMCVLSPAQQNPPNTCSRRVPRPRRRGRKSQ